MIAIESLDHLVLTCRDQQATLDFYVGILGMERQDFGEGLLAVRFGRQKMNLHPYPSPIAPLVARKAEPGTADLCFIVRTPVAAAADHLKRHGIAIEVGPVRRTGATGELLSIYCRDPDGNLVELANRV